MNKFINLCGRAVELNNSLIKEDQLEFQLKLDQGYHEIKQTLTKKYGYEIIQNNQSFINVIKKENEKRKSSIRYKSKTLSEKDKNILIKEGDETIF